MAISPRPFQSPPLVVRFGAVGDMIMATAVLQALARRHGQPCDVVGHGRWLAQLYRHLPFVGQVLALDSLRLHFLLEPRKRAIHRWLRQRGPGPVYLLQSDPHTVALARHGRFAITARSGDHPRGSGEHTIAQHHRIAGMPPTDVDAPRLMVSGEEVAECRAWCDRLGLAGAPLVLIQAGNRKTRSWRQSASDHKIWPLAAWRSVVQGVLGELPAARVLLIGAPKEQPLARLIASAVGDARVLAVADQLPLRRLFALQTMAHSMISVDTGPAHAAGALGCPVVVLFGQTDPRAVAPIARRAAVRCVVPPRAEGLSPGAPWPAGCRLDDLQPASVLGHWRTAAMERVMVEA